MGVGLLDVGLEPPLSTCILGGGMIQGWIGGPLVVRNAGIVRSVDSLDLYQRTWSAVAASSDLNMSALHAELRTADVTVVEADVLYDNEKVSQRGTGWDGALDAVLLSSAPMCIDAWITAAETRFVDLEPVTRAIVAVQRAGCFGHVDEFWTGVLDELIVPELEADSAVGDRGVCAVPVVAPLLRRNFGEFAVSEVNEGYRSCCSSASKWIRHQLLGR
jgi:hypothetical protein